MIVGIFALLLFYSYVLLTVVIVFRNRRRSGPEVRPRRIGHASTRPSVARMDDEVDSCDEQEQLWTALDEVQLIRLLREAAHD
jgi:hypothetical protein